jgi:hypothetical protein
MLKPYFFFFVGIFFLFSQGINKFINSIMKKITLLLVFLLSIAMGSYAQCIRPNPFGSIVSNNTGLPQTITTCAYTSEEYSVVSGLSVGADYLFTGQTGTSAGLGTDNYLTITDTANNVLLIGYSPLTFTAITNDTVRIHYAIDEACTGASTCNNATVTAILTCPIPLSVLLDGITTTTANFTWTLGGSETEWEVLILPNGDPAPDSETSGTVVSGTSAYLASSLTEATAYRFYIRASCGGGEYSPWILGSSFVTSCTALSSLPWEENFDTTATGSNIFPPCWSYTNTSSDWSITTFPTAYSGSNSLRRGWSTNGWAYTPLVTMNAGTSYTLTYFMRTNDAIIGYDIAVSVGNGQTEADMTENLSTVTGYQGPTWTKFTFSYTPATTGDFSFGIHVVAPFAPNGIYFDDFKIDLTPSCVEPTELVASNVGEATATVSYTESITAPATGYAYYLSQDITNPDADTTPSGTVNAGVLTFDLTALSPNTVYYVWVRSVCVGSDVSEWSTKVMFKTLCIAATDLFENFDASTNIPDCWSKVGTLGSVSVSSFNTGFSVPNNMALGSFNTTDLATVALPTLSNTAAATHQLKFKARSQYTWSIGGMVEVGYLTDINDASSFVMLESYTTTSGTVYDTFTANLGTQPESLVLAMRNPGTPPNAIVIDDVSWAPIPTAAPSCAVVSATPDVACGNFATVITWDPVDGVDGYNLSIGTTTGGTDIMNNEPIGDVNSYSFVGIFNTTYFYTLTPFNAFGSATGCLEQSFATFVDGCYCTSNPTSNDGSGITNVQLGSTDFPNGDVVYADYTSTPVDLAQGLSTNLQVSFATGFTYDTNVWIDFNNDLNFDNSEIVISGVSPQPNPSNLNLTFTMPADAALGTHRMRLGSSDFGQVPPNPCYSGSWGVTIDFSVNIIISTCTPASVVSSAVVEDCANSQYFVAVEIDSLGSGTPSITDGTLSYPVAAVGTVQVGPFASGTSTNLLLLHGTETICNVPLGSFSSTCPPANDECSTATPMLITGDFATSAVVWNNTGGTLNASNPQATCGVGFSSPIKDVWFQSTAPESGNVTVETQGNGGILDTAFSVYTGDCDNLVLAACDDDNGIGNYSLYYFSGLTPGQPLYIRLWGYNGVVGSALVGCYDSALVGTNSFDTKNFTYYPNPIKDVLNISYTKNISNVTVFNLLGQQIATKVVNANQSKIDMSNLATGTYLVKVTSDNQVKTIKVIKE